MLNELENRFEEELECGCLLTAAVVSYGACGEWSVLPENRCRECEKREALQEERHRAWLLGEIDEE